MNNRSNRALRRVTRLFTLLGVTVVGLCNFASSLSAQGTVGTITGVVTGEGGVPVSGVQVTLVNRGIGATTDANGRYTIGRAPSGTYTIRAQRIGFAPVTQTVTVTDNQTSTANFSMTQVATTLTTQVVVGYTTQQRRDVSDAVASVRADEIRDQKVATLEEALKGRVPGVNVASSGEPGRPAQVIIRGQNFISGGVSPLYVVDGMYLSENPNLNPDEIESIEVLKDASAAAQYGAQAANGVIVIRTKHGVNGETRTELHSYYGSQSVPKKIPMMNSAQWAAITSASYAAAGQTPPAGVLNPTISTDWQDAVFQSGNIQDHNLSLSGGSPNQDYLIGAGYLEQKGTIISTGFKRYSVRLNSEARRSRFTLGENLALSHSARTNLNGFPLIDAMRMFPTIPVYDPNNVGGFGYGTDANPNFGTNPVGQQLARNNTDKSNQVIGTGYADVALIGNLHYRFNLGVNYANDLNRNFSSIAQLRYRTPQINGATLSEQTGNITSLLFENLLLFNNAFGSNGMHKLNAAAGITSQRQDDNELYVYRQGFTDESLTQIDAGSTANLNNRGWLIQNRLNAALLRANYTLLDRYLFTGSIRRDGSSRFGPGNRYANFGAGSIGWVLSDEGFYKSIPLLSRAADYLKIRASTGTLGNQDIGDYQFSSPIIQNQNYMFGGNVVSGSTQLSLANPNIRWQSNKQTNIGFDFGLLDDRVTFSADHYVSTSQGLLVTAPIPWSLGSSQLVPFYPFVIPQNPVVNAGSVRNTGFEFNLAHHYEGAFKLNTTVNFTTIHNRVVSLGNGGQPIYAGFDNVARTAVGHPIGEFWVYHTAGIFQSAADVAAHPAQARAQPGDVIFVDKNGDGVLDDNDRYAAGSGIPKWTGGLFFNGNFRSFDFGLNMNGSHGAKIFNVERYWSDRTDDPQNHRAGYTPWTATNPSTTTPRAVFGPAGFSNDRPNSDRWIEDGSYWRIQNIVLGYTLPPSLLERTGLRAEAPRIYLNVQNVHTFTSYTGWDPEILGQADPLARGIDDGRIYPNVRTVSFGLDLRM